MSELLAFLLSLLCWWHSAVPAEHASRSEVRTPICTATAGERWLIDRESGGDVNAYNPVSTSTGHAFGLGQLTDENRIEYGRRLGIDPNSTRFCDQLRLMRAYIADRYRSTSQAIAHWQMAGSY